MMDNLILGTFLIGVVTIVLGSLRVMVEIVRWVLT